MSIVISYLFFFFQAEDGIRDAQESRGLGDVYKRQVVYLPQNVTLQWDGIIDETATSHGLLSRLDALQSWFRSYWGVISICANHSGLDGTVFAVLESLLLPLSLIHI
eukprot:TRINITY_DN22098_c0_g1_i1.p1 TRINITY_DN22098_c0_g1~~TRINITY_DN22098_c0_g1_i1.p1  ORF type:complete len:107 (+),score=17.94 TRINITY_DN22098_c0_g1_i1:72-392(+)